ncbi:MAG: type IV fimbrial biogenesis protein FimT, partial [Gammaproteobacteria bacterium]
MTGQLRARSNEREMKKQTGLTLIELLVTVAVAAILAALAVPSFNDFIKNERIVAEANDIVAALYLARTEALKRNRRVTVCPSADADAAAPSCTIDSAGNWSSGYIIFTDGNREAGTDANGVFEPAAPSNEVLIKAKGQIVGNLRLDATAADIRG